MLTFGVNTKIIFETLSKFLYFERLW